MLKSPIMAIGMAVILAGCALAPRTSSNLVIRDVTVYSGNTEAPYRATVAIQGGLFAAIDRSRSVAAQRAIDGRGLFMMPGLWDMHTHVALDPTQNIDIDAFMRHGVTSIRDVGSLPDEVQALRTAVSAGELPGPSIYWAGPTLNGRQLAPFHRAVTTAHQVKAAIAEVDAAGVDLVKIHRALAPDLLPVAIEAAHAHGLKITGHIPLGVSPLEACERGMDGIEHVGSFIEALVAAAPAGGKMTADEAVTHLESPEAEPLYQCLAKRRVAVTPTLVFYPAVARSRTEGGPLSAEFVKFLDAIGRITLRFHQAGVVLAAGTDTAFSELEIAPGESLNAELELLQDAGIPARDIIVIATSNAARALGVEAKTGTIEVGKAADFLLLEADPGIDIVNVRKLRAVYRGGVQLGRSE